MATPFIHSSTHCLSLLAARPTSTDNGSPGRDSPLLELRRRKASCPALEKLHCVYSCFHLSRQILYCEILNGVDDCSKSGWVSIGHTARKAVILGALSRDHISGDRPGTASKTQKAGLCRKSSFHESHGFINRLQLFLA